MSETFQSSRSIAWDISRPSSKELTSENIDTPTLTLYPSHSSTTSEASDESVFSSASSQYESNSSSDSGEGTPIKGVDKSLCLSESATPSAADENSFFDPDQLTLRLYIRAALSGTRSLPKWDGLAGALQVYFANSWQKDQYTLQDCEEKKHFLFWNAVGDSKWQGYAEDKKWEGKKKSIEK
jgi:hypothetical protein